jgi:hypothetical protein
MVPCIFILQRRLKSIIDEHIPVMFSIDPVKSDSFDMIVASECGIYHEKI